MEKLQNDSIKYDREGHKYEKYPEGGTVLHILFNIILIIEHLQ